uniref:Uncharacterized protein n=1 Tax=Oryza meridionalis TaxID=40149 RepID=A0A0E0E2A7_9ORYZ
MPPSASAPTELPTTHRRGYYLSDDLMNVGSDV